MSDLPDTPVSAPSFLKKDDGARIAYHKTTGQSPGIVFLGGFMSDMTGTKATVLEAYAQERGQAFLRFDYQGHGQSSGAFVDGTIGLWASDAIAAIDALTEGPQILIGSSMGGWIMLLAALARLDRVAGLIGIAAAPDFTEDLMWAEFDEETRELLRTDGMIKQFSEYGDDPYQITWNLILEGRKHLLLRHAPVAIDRPVRLLHGMKDEDVPWELSPRLAEALVSSDVQVRLIKEGDHRLSTDEDLEILKETVSALLDGQG